MVLGPRRIGSNSFTGRMETCAKKQKDSGSGQALYKEDRQQQVDR